jgi:catechol 2,3-dioxygenase-like lactoylglutathione lyase family enzyme
VRRTRADIGLRYTQYYCLIRTAPFDTLTLSHLGLASADPAATTRFYERVVGMTVGERDSGGATRLGWGRGHHALEITDSSGLDHMAFEVVDGDIERFERRLAQRGVTIEWETPWGDDHPPSLVFHDPDGTRVELHGPVDRSGEYQGQLFARPDRLHHVTLASSTLQPMADFYVDVLGFRVSDEQGDDEGGIGFVWLRSDREHHSLAVVKAPHVGLDHLAFEVPSWEAIGRWCDELSRRNVPLTWGPGRHGPGNNLFAFFDDVDGRRIELSCEMERFWDDRADYAQSSRRWDPGAGVVNLWGPLPSWREAASP